MAGGDERTRVVILGAAGRDFHDYNTLYRDDPRSRVVAFTATQIPGIEDRRYPPALAGPLYPDGIPIVDEATLEKLCASERIDEAVFAYSDVSHQWVMHVASRVLAAGADFRLVAPARTMLPSRRPVIAVTAVRTGCGKSQVARYLSRALREAGHRVGVLRHPMPYGNLAMQAVQRFATRDDLAAGHCTIEEREEYEPHIAFGNVVFAGVDYARILAAAEAESDVILWDGGNNDLPFVAPGLSIVLVDALRPAQLTTHHPGETSLRLADIVLVSKANAADEAVLRDVEANLAALRPGVRILRGRSEIAVPDPKAIAGKRVLVVEDGPTITHGGMPHGAGYAAARRWGAAEVVDPRPFAVGSIAAAYDAYRHIGPVLPALGYSDAQLRDLAATIDAAGAELVIVATPIDLAALIEIRAPAVRVAYDYAEWTGSELLDAVTAFVDGARA
jgi:predicted GTPase